MKLRVLRCWKDAVPADTFRLPGDTAPSALPAGGWGPSVARRGEKRDQRASAPKLSGWVRAATPSRVGMPSGRQLAAPAAQRPFPQVSILKEKSPLNLSSSSKRHWCEGGGHRGIIRPSGCSLLETGGPWLGTGVALPLVHSHRSPGLPVESWPDEGLSGHRPAAPQDCGRPHTLPPVDPRGLAS